ncbi:MAG: RHS repeat-associated core domain-containing protein [Isosphaerales bacterium]
MKYATKLAALGALTILIAVPLWTGTSAGYVFIGGDPPVSGPAPGERFTNLSAGGLLAASKTDLYVAAPMPLILTRVYRSRDMDAGGAWIRGPFGLGTEFEYGMFLYSKTESNYQFTDVEVVLPDGGQVLCNLSQGTGGTSSAVYTCNKNPGPFFGAIIQYNYNTPGWDFILKNGTIYSFGIGTPLQSIHDRYGNSITITHSNGQTGNITQVTATNGRYIIFTYGDPNNPNQVTKATDNSGRYVTYVYDSNHRMTSSVDAFGTTTTFAYVNTGTQLGDVATAIIDPTPGSNVRGTAAYDAGFRVKTLTGTLGNSSFTYTVSNGAITECDITTTSTKNDGNTVTRKLLFNNAGYVTVDKRAVGSSPNIEADYTYTRDSSSSLITQVTDPLLYNGVNRTTAYCYDTANPTWNTPAGSWSTPCVISEGNITGVTYAGSINPSPCSPGASACTYTYAYDPKFNELQSITDPLGHTWSAVIDSSGNMDSLTLPNPPGDTWNYTYNAQGQLKSIIDPGFYAGGGTITTSYGYNSQSDLTSTTNGANNTTSFGVDTVGRTTSVTDPLRETTSYAYDALDRVTQVTDPNGHTTQYQYDTLGTLTKVTDGNGHSQTFTPSYTLGLTTQEDAVGNEWQFFYDVFGNLTGTIDGRGLVTNYTYDALNRLATSAYNFDDASGVGLQYPSTVAYTWDKGNRLTKVVDSVAGTITRGYDPLDNLTSEQTPQGTVSYTYDAASRRATMSVPNQAQTNYLYDNANQLCVITQGSSLPNSCPAWGAWSPGETLIFRWLNGLVADVWLPVGAGSGAERAYAYNNDYTLNFILTAGYQAGSWSTLSAMYNTRDAAGRLTQVTNYAGYPAPAVNLPSAASASYQVNNQLSKWNGTAVSADGNGNLKSDGLGHSFTWNERNQLAEIAVPTATGTPVAELMQYDASGRRQHLDIFNGPGTNFLYDGLNPVQEQNVNGVETANLLTGLGVDEILTRSDASGTMGFLTDPIVGSTSGLVNSSGNQQTTYTYGPFGATSSSGTANANPYQFTGRELDPNSGLYFMRNRYYSPTLQRFISPDPTGIAGGDANLYAYAHNDPTNLVDPLGLCAESEPNPSPPFPILCNGCFDIPYQPGGGGSGTGPIGPLRIQGGNLLLAKEVEGEEGGGLGEDIEVEPSAPVGSLRSPLKLVPPNSPEPGYVDHAFDKMQMLGIPRSVVEDAIQNGEASPARNGRTRFYSPTSGVAVIVEPDGTVVTVYPRH